MSRVSHTQRYLVLPRQLVIRLAYHQTEVLKISTIKDAKRQNRNS